MTSVLVIELDIVNNSRTLNFKCEDQTVGKYGIIVLLGQVWVYARKDKTRCKDISSTTDIIPKIPTAEVCEYKF